MSITTYPINNNLTVTLGGTGGGGTGPVSYSSQNATWANNPTITNNSNSIHGLSVERSGKIRLTGNDPDVMIGDMSLKETLAGIQQQLGILQSNRGLEERWEKLRKIREEYDACLADIVEKETIWNELKR